MTLKDIKIMSITAFVKMNSSRKPHCFIVRLVLGLPKMTISSSLRCSLIIYKFANGSP